MAPHSRGSTMNHSEGAGSHLLVPIFTDFYRFFRFVVLLVFSHDYLSNTTTLFFSEFVLQRNRHIRRVELFEARSLPRKIWETSRSWPLEGSLEGPWKVLFGARVARSHCAGQGEKLAPRHHPRASRRGRDRGQRSRRDQRAHRFSTLPPP